MAFTTGPVELDHQIEEGDDIAIVDVREEEDYRKGHVPGALNLPQDRWHSAEGILRRDSTNILYCYSPTCHLAAKAAVQFAEQGYHVMEMDGGFEAWKHNKLKTEK
jgi:rhodanese-related sulfurtransferase